MPVTKEEIISWIPKEHKAVLPNEDLFIIITQDLSFESTAGGIVVSRNGEEIRNSTTMAPVSPQEVIKNYFSDRKWLDAVKIAEMSESQKMEINSLSAFTQYWSGEHPGGNTMSSEFDNALSQHSKDVKDFDWYK